MPGAGNRPGRGRFRPARAGPAWRRRLRRAGCGALIGAVLLAGCAGGHPAPAARCRGPGQAGLGGPAAAAGLAGARPAPGLRRSRVRRGGVLHRLGQRGRGTRRAAVLRGPLRPAGHPGTGPAAGRQPAPGRRLAGDAPRAAGQPGAGAGRHPPRRRPRPHRVGGVPAGLRHPGDRHHGRARRPPATASPSSSPARAGGGWSAPCCSGDGARRDQGRHRGRRGSRRAPPAAHPARHRQPRPARRHGRPCRPGRRRHRARRGGHPAALPDVVHGRRPDLPRPALVGAGRDRRGRIRPRPSRAAGRAQRRELRRRRRADAVRARHLQPSTRPARTGR